MNLFSENYADYPDDEGRKLLWDFAQLRDYTSQYSTTLSSSVSTLSERSYANIQFPDQCQSDEIIVMYIATQEMIVWSGLKWLLFGYSDVLC
jgi:hypothetical protein